MRTEQKNYDLRRLLKPYANKWVALSRDRRKIIAQGNELKEVIKKAGSKDVTLLKVFPEKSFYVPQS
jgi:hypothetical protein